MEDSLPQNQPSEALAIVEQDGKFLLDSRVLAKQLGYEHKVVLQSIRRHKSRLEAKSLLLQNEAKPSKGSMGGRPETYYMLDERQSLILTGSLKKGTEADEWHDRLVDEFLAARAMVKQLQKQLPTQPQTELFPMQAILYDRTQKNWRRVPDGYFGILPELYTLVMKLTYDGYDVPMGTKTDVSVGTRWKAYALEHYGIEPSGQYGCLDDKDVPRLSYYYPMDYLQRFRIWVEDVFFVEHFQIYLKGAIERQAKKHTQIEKRDKNHPQIEGK
jgi:phage regulator Rha-like protein